MTSPHIEQFYGFSGWKEHPKLRFYRVEEHVDDVVYQENMFCPIILGHICRFKILKMSNLMFSQSGGTPKFVIFQGGATCG